ncbi:hypothetical protein K438DRAFT_1847598 [Mycena galopus ATCC 62051]|nr:hypothetical protein K438DRAFT_1847598 [Mycena galopus ATCC 62051]
MSPIMPIPSSKIPFPRFLTAPARPLPYSLSPNSEPYAHSLASDDAQDKREALALRVTCTTPAFNQSTKFSSLAPSDQPANPFMHRGHGICTIPRYTDYKTALEDEGSPPTRSASRILKQKPSRLRVEVSGSEDEASSSSTPSSGSLSRKPSRFRLRLRPSKSSLRSSDGSSSEQSSRCSSPATTVSNEKPLPLPPLFSPCSSPIDEYYLGTPATEVPPPLTPPQSRFKIRRKPVPAYIPGSEYLPKAPLPAVDADSASSLSSVCSSESDSSANDSSPDDGSALQIVGPNVFIAYDDDPTASALATAFTHIIHLSPAGSTRRDVLRTPTYNSETGVHTLRLPIPSPISHRDIQFASSLNIRRKPVPESMILAPDLDMPVLTEEEPLSSDPHCLSCDDLIATQEFLAASGRVVSLPEVAYLLADGPCDAPSLGLQLTQIDTVLSFLRPHPFAPTSRRRLAIEGLALMACYLAQVDGRSVRSVLRKFEGSVVTVSKSWRGLLGNDGAACLEELLLA